jgi:hypothetical protein
MRFVAACWWSFGLAACHAPEPGASPAPPSAAPASDVVAGDVVATVLGRPITRDQLVADEKYAILPAVLQPLLDDFASREGIDATEPEIDRFVQFLTESTEGEPDLFSGQLGEEVLDVEIQRQAIREVAQGFVKNWKICRALYARYGGTVIFQQSNPLEPVGAYLAFLRAHERKGSFHFHDDRLAAQFWDYFTRDHGPWVVDPEKVDYSVPWWESR